MLCYTVRSLDGPDRDDRQKVKIGTARERLQAHEEAQRIGAVPVPDNGAPRLLNGDSVCIMFVQVVLTRDGTFTA